MLFQIRNQHGSKLLQTNRREDIREFLESRNATCYKIWGLKPLTMEVRFITPAKRFLTDGSTSAPAVKLNS